MNPPIYVPNEWPRSEAFALAQQSCTFCFGMGLRCSRGGESTPCNCVYRAIFRACYEHYLLCEQWIANNVDCQSGECLLATYRSPWTLEKLADYRADFILVARRTLSLKEHKIFRYHYILKADWKLCCRHLNMDRGGFFHEVYRIERKLGATFRCIEPYPLFPLYGYAARLTAKSRP